MFKLAAMFGLHFAEHSLWVFFPLMGFLLASIILFVQEKNKAAFYTLVIAALGIRIFMAGLDPFIHMWDERYHALVAKNMLQDPFKPMLFREEILWLDYKQWIGNHIWLHKQPLALWQIALSYSLFGVSAFTTCIPSIILGVLMLILIYDIARKCFNVQIAYFAALLYGFSYFTLKFTNGSEAVDHVDMAFFFYITASFWAFVSYNITKKRSWRIAIGIFAGLAVLTKWLTGLLVFAGWGIIVLMDEEQRKSISAYLKIFYTFLISLLIFLPWQIYTFIRFPKEAAFEMTYNRRHLFEVIEEHGGGFWFYIERLDENFGWFAPFVILPGLYFFLRNAKYLTTARFLLACAAVCYLFFSIARTKMNAYCHPVSSVIFIMLAAFMYEIYKYFSNKTAHIYASKIMLALLLSFVTYHFIDLPAMEWNYTFKNTSSNYRHERMQLLHFYKSIDKQLPDNYVIFGAPNASEIEGMFYTGNMVYNAYPDKEIVQKLKEQNRPIAVITSANMPLYLADDKEIKKIVFGG